MNNITPGNSGQTGVMAGTGPDSPSEHLFQQGLFRQRLAQVAPPPVAPAPTVTTPVTPGGQLMPAPVFLNPNAPQNGQLSPGYELTPYTPVPIPTYTPKPAGQPGAVQGTGNSQLQGVVERITNDAAAHSANTPAPTDISALNQGLSKVSDTLRLQLLSPAVQLTVNRAADQNVGLNTEYALGLQTAGDGDHLALVGSLQDLIGLLSQAENAQFFTPMLNADASVTLKGLQQRYTQALNTEAGRVALNHTRTQLKQLETASARGHQSFKQLYPNLSMSTITDRSNAWKNGIGANRQADRLGAGLDQTYVLGYQLPVKLNNNTTVPVPINLVGPLKDLGQFILRGGDSWLQASGLSSNKSTGLTPTGVMQRYGVAKANAGDTFNPDQRSENQTGGTTGQQLVSDVEITPPNDPESTVQTTLADGAEKSPFITVKPADPDEKQSKGIIAPQLSQNMQPANPSTESSDTNGPIRASGAEGSDTPKATDGSHESIDKETLFENINAAESLPGGITEWMYYAYSQLKEAIFDGSLESRIVEGGDLQNLWERFASEMQQRYPFLREADMLEFIKQSDSYGQEGFEGFIVKQMISRYVASSRAQGQVPDLSGLRLQEMSLNGIDLDRTNLQNIYFVMVDLIDASIKEADMTGAIIDWGNLSGANMSGSYGNPDIDSHTSDDTILPGQEDQVPDRKFYKYLEGFKDRITPEYFGLAKHFMSETQRERFRSMVSGGIDPQEAVLMALSDSVEAEVAEAPVNAADVNMDAPYTLEQMRLIVAEIAAHDLQLSQQNKDDGVKADNRHENGQASNLKQVLKKVKKFLVSEIKYAETFGIKLTPQNMNNFVKSNRFLNGGDELGIPTPIRAVIAGLKPGSDPGNDGLATSLSSEQKDLLRLLTKIGSVLDYDDIEVARYLMSPAQQKYYRVLLELGGTGPQTLYTALSGGVQAELDAAPTDAQSVDPDAPYTLEQKRLIVAAIARYQQDMSMKRFHGQYDPSAHSDQAADLNRLLDSIKHILVDSIKPDPMPLIDRTKIGPAQMQQAIESDIFYLEGMKLPEQVQRAISGLRPDLTPISLDDIQSLRFEDQDMQNLEAAIAEYKQEGRPSQGKQQFLIEVEQYLPVIKMMNAGVAASDSVLTFAQIESAIRPMARGITLPPAIEQAISEPQGLDRELRLYAQKREIQLSPSDIEFAQFAAALGKAYRSGQADLAKPSVINQVEKQVQGVGGMSVESAGYLKQAINNSETPEALENKIENKLKPRAMDSGLWNTVRLLELFLMGLKHEGDAAK